MDKAKYQWSIKQENGEIFVVQSNDFNELKLDIEQIKIYLRSSKRQVEQSEQQKKIEEQIDKPFVDHTRREWNGLHFEDYEKNKLCPECGEEAWVNEGISKKTNKPYKNIKCKKNPEHITWGTV